MAFNFKFNKVKGPSKLKPVSVALDEPEKKEETKTDFVLSIDNNTVKSATRAEEKTPLVIPLIKNNVWRGKRKNNGAPVLDTDRTKGITDTTKPSQSATPADDISAGRCLDEEARRELISEAKSLNETASSSSSNKIIPLLVQNKVPDGYEEDDNFDVSLRPEKPSAEDYERVPVSEFGMAMLRGMGFDEKKFASVAPVEVTVRYKGLGLGAEAPPPLSQPPPSTSSLKPIDGETRKTVK